MFSIISRHISPSDGWLTTCAHFALPFIVVMSCHVNTLLISTIYYLIRCAALA